MNERKTRMKRWMQRNVSTFVDRCNEVNCTGMAEEAAQVFETFENRVDWTIPEWVFDMAVDVANWFKGSGRGC
jgi:hypothetical protein